MKKLFFAIAALAAISSGTAHAGGWSNPYCGQGTAHGYPVFQAAPWYLYWPYNQHFQTPAPMMGAYYAPPSTGAALVSPYFPAQPTAPR